MNNSNIQPRELTKIELLQALTKTRQEHTGISLNEIAHLIKEALKDEEIKSLITYL